MQIFVEVTLLVVVALADVRRNVDVPVGLVGVDRKTLPAPVVRQSEAAQRSCDGLRSIAVDTRSNTLRVSVL